MTQKSAFFLNLHKNHRQHFRVELQPIHSHFPSTLFNFNEDKQNEFKPKRKLQFFTTSTLQFFLSLSIFCFEDQQFLKLFFATTVSLEKAIVYLHLVPSHDLLLLGLNVI